jgi:hypothetical protein
MINVKYSNSILFLYDFYSIELKIRTEIIKVLIDFYRRIPTAKYYEVASYNYKHGKNKIYWITISLFFVIALPPAEVFSFCLHTILTELASTSDDDKSRDNVN